MARAHIKLPPDMPELLTGEQVLAALKIERRQAPGFLYRLRQKGLLPSIRIGKAYRYPEEGVRALLRGEINAA